MRFDSGPAVFVSVNRNYVLTEYVLNENDCRRLSFSAKWHFPEDKIDERAPSKKKLNITEPSVSFPPQNRPSVVLEAEPRAPREVCFRNLASGSIVCCI